MEKLRSETPAFEFVIKATPVDPLMALTWTYSTEYEVSLLSSGEIDHVPVRRQDVPFVVILLHAVDLIRHVEHDDAQVRLTLLQISHESLHGHPCMIVISLSIVLSITVCITFCFTPG